MTAAGDRPSIFGRDRVVLDGIARRIHRAIATEYPHTDLRELRRGSTFDIQHTIGGDEFVARITIELVPWTRDDPAGLGAAGSSESSEKDYGSGR